MAEGKFTKEVFELNEKQIKSRRARNWAIALSLVAFVVLVYILTVAKLGINLYNREL